MNKELIRVLVVGMVTSVASYYLVNFLDRKKILPQLEKSTENES